ncbi:MAG: molybdopterin-binding protein [Myxococcota bacterium]
MSDSTHPTAAILIIGDEVLSGKVQDANGPFLIRALRERGVQVTEVRVIGDTIDGIIAAARELSSCVTHLFTTGGIGPTHDDKTIEAISAAFGRAVVRHPELERRLETHYGGPLSAARRHLAAVPAGAEVVLDPGDYLPLIRVENVYVFPGVPALMRLCFERMADRLEGTPFFSEALYLDIVESRLAEELSAVQESHPQVAIGSYPRFEPVGYRVKVTVDGRDQRAVELALKALREALDPAWIVDIEPS